MNNPLTYHQRFSQAELNTQYNLREGRPDYEATVIPEWQHKSATARAQINCTLDIPYGTGQKQALDVFTCATNTATNAPTLVYFHGGYWQRGDKSIYSFIAKPFTNAGVNVVVVGYDLCPQVSITDISQQARQAMAYLWNNADQLGLQKQHITVMGHSAGGHITQMLMATDWPTWQQGLPQNVLKAGIPISPLSYLEPVRLTVLNEGIRMDAEEAQSQSPMVNHPPITNAPQCVIVGGAETDEFHRQARMYVDAFASHQRLMDLYVVPAVDHFDELNVLTDPNSACFAKVMAMLKNTL